MKWLKMLAFMVLAAIVMVAMLAWVAKFFMADDDRMRVIPFERHHGESR